MKIFKTDFFLVKLQRKILLVKLTCYFTTYEHFNLSQISK